MIDDQVDAEELADSRRQRQAAAKAAENDTPVAPENKSPVMENTVGGAPRQWMRSARKWLGARSGLVRP
ncbi:hypothetical protein ACTJLB_00895 [Paraburkholderia sp. 22098]|uniref:hypothetical protein n=1 Tax=Paraburkholderia sp. 22098 TaxID=3453874 RepID=UPI003F83879B